MHIGVERIDAIFVGTIGCSREREQGLAAKARLEREDVAPGKLSDKSQFQGVLDGGCAADSGQEEFEAGEALKSPAQLSLGGKAGVCSSHCRACGSWRGQMPGCVQLTTVARGIVAAKAAGNSTHRVEDRATIDNDERAGSANSRGREPCRSNEPVKRGVIVAPKPLGTPS